MTMEYAGAVEVVPPFRAGARDWVRSAGWTPSPDGQTIRPRPDISLQDCVGTLRDLVAWDLGQRTYTGVVAAYDSGARELVTVTVRDGRVTRRTLRRSPDQKPTNVIDLASHRRAASRRIS
jgi:hypothetical protein